ncbi:MAG: sugar ABC transporter substrate-binding protein [Chloroflexota bacterium]
MKGVFMASWMGRVLLATLMTVVLAACAPAPAAPVGTSRPAATAATLAEQRKTAASGEVAFWVFGDVDEQAVFQAVIDAFRKTRPGISVTLTAIPNVRDFSTRLGTALASGAPPDVFLVNYRRFGQYAGKDVVESLEPWMERGGGPRREELFEAAVNAFSVNGAINCLPQNQSSLVVYYNRDLFQRFGVALPPDDWRWEDFLETARRLTVDTDGDGRPDVYGLGMEPSIVRAAPFVWQNGGSVIAGEGAASTMALDSPAAQDALRFFLGLSTVHRVVPTEADVKAEDLDARFLRGKLGMVLNSRRIVPELRAGAKFAWDVAPLPRGRERATVLHSDAYCMSAGSKNKPAAWELIQFAIGREGQEIASRLGRTVPSLKAVAESSAFLDPGQAPSRARVFLDAMSYMHALPTLNEWPAVERTLGEELEAMFYGTVDTRAGLAGLNAKGASQLGRR